YNVNQINDIQKIMPDVTVNTQVGSFQQISIREVQMIQFNPIFETTVATHLDGIQLNRFAGLDNFFFDLERVEVLKGPQGTLYGRGSTAGSMNMISRKPILDMFSGNASIEAGNYGRYRADWAVNIPIVDNMAIRISGRRNLFDGYSDSEMGNLDSWSHRLSFLWEPNDRTTIKLTGDYMESDDDGSSMFIPGSLLFIPYGPTTPTIVPSELYPEGGPLVSRYKSKWAIGDLKDENIATNEHYGFMAEFDYDFDFATATVQYGYRNQKEYKEFMWVSIYATAPDWSPVAPATQLALNKFGPMLFMINHNEGKTSTMEARLTSKSSIAAGDKFEWIAGVMGQKDQAYEQTEMAKGAVDTDPVTGTNWFRVIIDTETTGIFGQASYMPIPKWNFTVGVRQNNDDKEYWGNYNVRNDEGVYDRSLFLPASKGFSELTYRANISYIAKDDIMPYISYAKGYKTGNISYERGVTPPELLDSYEIGLKSRWLDNKLQFNSGFYYYDYKNYGDWVNVTTCYSDLNTSDLEGVPGDHMCDDVGGNPDSTTNPGITYDPATGVLHPDGSVDGSDYSSSHYVGYSPGGAEQMGLSVSVLYMPTMNDNISFNASWRHNEYKKGYNHFQALLKIEPSADSIYVDEAKPDLDLGGEEFPNTVPIRGNVSYTHTFRFGGFDTLMTTLGVFYEGEGVDVVMNRGNAVAQYEMPGRDDYITADFSLVYSSNRWLGQGRMWSLRGSVNNIFDNDALSSKSYNDDSNFGVFKQAWGVGNGYISGDFIAPRIYSVTLSINF
ncbi:MAG: TonB-dependent receptor, partial [Deltaproteobacteria bacterium]|nr:TonB-dependent receptor [Deltaproteobacteria bacterium]